MKTINTLKLVKSTLLVTVAVTGLGFGVVVASSVENFVSPKQAAHAEDMAQNALTKKHYDEAIAWGEKAVLGEPRNADYRMVLAQANLASGHFASAQQLFADVLTLDPTHPRAALNLALTQIALAHSVDAHTTLEAHRDQIAPADLGLALALSGDTDNGVRILEQAARGDDATAKTRQNLALAYALAGRWDVAKVTAGQDLSSDAVDQRMSDWAQMVHPKAAWDQVAMLLHVTPTNDAGLPYQLALQSTPNSPALAQAAPAPVVVPTPAPEPLAVVQAPAPVETVAAETPRYEAPVAMAPSVEKPEVAPTHAMAPAPQPAPHVLHMAARDASAAPLIQAAKGPAKRFIAERARVKAVTVAHNAKHPMVHLAMHHVRNSGYAVQIGAYASPALAHAAWTRDIHKVSALRNYAPAQSQFSLHRAAYYRLAVTGFGSRTEAGNVCAKLHAAGGQCFVRTVQGDQLAAWARPASVQRMAHVKSMAPKLAAKAPAPVVVKVAAKPAAPAKPVVPKMVAPKLAAKPVAKVTPKQTANNQVQIVNKVASK